MHQRFIQPCHHVVVGSLTVDYMHLIIFKESRVERTELKLNVEIIIKFYWLLLAFEISMRKKESLNRHFSVQKAQKPNKTSM